MGSSPKQEVGKKKLVKKWMINVEYMYANSRCSGTVYANSPTESEILAELCKKHPYSNNDTIKIIKIHSKSLIQVYE